MLHLGGLMTSLFLMASTPAASPQPALYQIQFLVMKTAPKAGKFSAERAVGLGNAVALGGRFALEWGSESLKSDGQLLVNGASFSPGSGRDEAGRAGTPAVLSSPLVTTPAGEAATLKAGTAENAQYFAREADGRFALKTIPVTPEMQFDVTLDRESSAGEVQMQLAFRFVRLGKRTPLEGVSLDVGAPEIHEDSGSGRVQLKLGEWCLVGLQSDLASGLVLLIKATRSR